MGARGVPRREGEKILEEGLLRPRDDLLKGLIKALYSRLVLKVTCYLAEGLHKSVQAPASQFLTCVLAIFLLFLRFFGARDCRKSNFDLRKRFASHS